jgi:hypothetical protein
MASEAVVSTLKSTLRREVTNFCGSGRGIWREPARNTLLQFHERGWSSVLFGGTLRSLLWSRLYRNRPGRPRDIDVVVRGVDVEDLRSNLSRVLRETRFGGLKVQRDNWQFDVWPLHSTWMFSVDQALEASFAQLPFTTAFNLEAIAVEVWPAKAGLPRIVFSGDDQFFEGMAGRFVELNRPENPFPELTVVRGLLLAQALDFHLGPRLAEFIADIGPRIRDTEIESLQLKHYGLVRQDSAVIRQLIQYIDHELQTRGQKRIHLPIIRQLNLFDDAPDCSTVRAFALE